MYISNLCSCCISEDSIMYTQGNDDSKMSTGRKGQEGFSLHTRKSQSSF